MIDIKKARRIPKNADLSRIHPDLRDKAVPCSILTAHPDNPRVHPEANRKAIAGSLKRFQQRNLIVVNQTDAGLRIEAHHEVFRQMLQLGSEYVAVAIMEDDPITEMGFLLADNRTGDLSEDDPARLAPILKQLAEAGEEVEEVGWDDATVKQLLGQTSHTPDDDKEDEAPVPVDRAGELQKVWGTEHGQIWEIPGKAGIHRVLCGDSLDPASIDLVLDGQVPDGVWSDAPYGINIVKSGHVEGGGIVKIRGTVGGDKIVKANLYAPIAGDENKNVARQSFAMLYEAFEKALHIWWGANHFSEAFPASSCWIVWDKENTGNFADAELAWCSDKGAVRICRHMWNGLLKASERGESRVHPTQKPVALFDWCAGRYLPDPGKVWLDPFAGSGISLLGAEKRGQIACCIELSPAYVAVILQRAKDAGMSPRLADA